jgi:signal transduction histidine kinase
LIEPSNSNNEAVNGPITLADDLRANRYDVLSRLADDLAHEIKNPLNAIVVNLEVMRQRMQNGAGPAALDRAGVIEHEVRRVHELVDQLLQLLRPEKASAGPIAIDDIIESLGSAVQLQAKAARVSFTMSSEPSLYAQIRGEPFKFALLNALTYAIDAEAAAGGSVALGARRAGSDIYVVLTCSHAVLEKAAEQLHYCRILMEAAGGTLESLEPQRGGSGCTMTLVMPPGRFGDTTTGSSLE